MNTDWSKKIEVGHDTIDNHHKELFVLTTLLDNAVKQQKEDTIVEILHFLETYVQDHFLEEEELMAKEQYEGLAYHKEQHDIFRELVKNLRTEFDSGNSKTHVIFKTRQFVDKLVNHILNVDIKIANIVHPD